MTEHRYRHTTHRTHNRDGVRRCQPGCFWPHGKCPTHTRLFEVRPPETIANLLRLANSPAELPPYRITGIDYGYEDSAVEVTLCDGKIVGTRKLSKRETLQPLPAPVAAPKARCRWCGCRECRCSDSMRQGFSNASSRTDRSEPPSGYSVARHTSVWHWSGRNSEVGCHEVGPCPTSRAEAVAACWAEYDKQSAQKPEPEWKPPGSWADRPETEHAYGRWTHRSGAYVIRLDKLFQARDGGSKIVGVYVSAALACAAALGAEIGQQASGRWFAQLVCGLAGYTTVDHETAELAARAFVEARG